MKNILINILKMTRKQSRLIANHHLEMPDITE